MNRKILLFLVGLALLLRVYKITSNPPSLSWDEVSIGYNAYSILLSGKDEHGKVYPLDTFVAFGDYKPPVPVYITVPFVWIFGLNELSVRLPVALAGVATVGLVYVLALLLFAANRYNKLIAALSGFVLAVSPWHTNLSRAGFEATIGLFFIVLSAVLFFLTKKNGKYFFVAFLPLTFAVYTFNSARYFAPFFALILLWYVKDLALKVKKQVGIGMLVATLTLVPIIPHLLSSEARLRFKEVNIFSDVGIVKLANSRIEAAGNTWVAKIVHNRRVYFGREYIKHYLDHFDPKFLFIRGDGNPKFSIQDVGQMYFFEGFLLLTGFLSMMIKHPRQSVLLLLWLVSAIIPAATARETPHALRILNTLPVWQIYVAYGIFTVISFVKRDAIKVFIIIVITLFYTGAISYYLHTYYNHYPYTYSGEWQYGYKQAFLYAEQVKMQYKEIIVTDYIGRPYAYALFYGKYNPTEYLNSKSSFFDVAGFYHVDSFGKYRFVRQVPSEFKADSLYILPEGAKPRGATEVFHINLLNGTPVLVGFHI
jgi:4-amino-4-deoxy-L-arabinose transferase-like glycosyltransferase